MPGTIVFSQANGFPAGTYRSIFEAWRIDGGHLFPFEKPAEAAQEVLRWVGTLELEPSKA